MAKNKKQFEKWIRKNIKKYTPILSIDLHEITIENKDNDSYLSIKCTYPYLDPTIYYSEESFNDWKKGKIKDDRILHELCHILTDPLYFKAISRYISKDEITDERERLTDTISAIIRKLI